MLPVRPHGSILCQTRAPQLGIAEKLCRIKDVTCRHESRYALTPLRGGDAESRAGNSVRQAKGWPAGHTKSMPTCRWALAVATGLASRSQRQPDPSLRVRANHRGASAASSVAPSFPSPAPSTQPLESPAVGVCITGRPNAERRLLISMDSDIRARLHSTGSIGSQQIVCCFASGGLFIRQPTAHRPCASVSGCLPRVRRRCRSQRWRARFSALSHAISAWFSGRLPPSRFSRR